MNTNIKMSDHARSQAQKRCVDPVTIDYLIEFGASSHCGGGCTRLYFNGNARKRLRGSIERTEYAQLEKKLDCFLVLNEQQSVVITVGHQFKKIKMH
jgi:hypothetical protein